MRLKTDLRIFGLPVLLDTVLEANVIELRRPDGSREVITVREAVKAFNNMSAPHHGDR